MCNNFSIVMQRIQMKFIVTDSIKEIEEYWNELCPESDMHFYQTYLFAEQCVCYRKTSISAIKRKNTKCMFVIQFNKERPVCIAPLIIDQYPEKTVRLLGYGTNAGYLDFIYKDGKYVESTLKHCLELFNGYRVEFTFVPETSPLCGLMEKMEKFSNYEIKLRSYEQYFNGLSKSTRQNIRTAYNRLNKDRRLYEMVCYKRDSDIFDKCLGKCNTIYHKRKAEWRQEKPVGKIREKIFLKRDVIYASSRKSKSSVLAVLYIDGICCAFFLGFVFTNYIHIPRLAIDTAYARYSPGIILINEFLKKIVSTKENYIFDLCRGDESYKSKLGGKETNTFRLAGRTSENSVL